MRIYRSGLTSLTNEDFDEGNMEKSLFRLLKEEKALYKSKAVTAACVKNSNELTHIGHTYVSQCPIIFPVVRLGFQIVRLRAASASLEEIESVLHYSPHPAIDSGNLYEFLVGTSKII